MRKELDNSYLAEVSESGKFLGKSKVEVQTNLDDVILKSVHESIDGGAEVYCQYDYLSAGMPIVRFKNDPNVVEYNLVAIDFPIPFFIDGRYSGCEFVGFVGKTIKNQKIKTDYITDDFGNQPKVYSSFVPVVTKGTVNVCAMSKNLELLGMIEQSRYAVLRCSQFLDFDIYPQFGGILYEFNMNNFSLLPAVSYEKDDADCVNIHFPAKTPIGDVLRSISFGINGNSIVFEQGAENIIGVSDKDVAFTLVNPNYEGRTMNYLSDTRKEDVDILTNVTISRSKWVEEFKKLNKNTSGMDKKLLNITNVDFSAIQSQLSALGITIVS